MDYPFINKLVVTIKFVEPSLRSKVFLTPTIIVVVVVYTKENFRGRKREGQLGRRKLQIYLFIYFYMT